MDSEVGLLSLKWNNHKSTFLKVLFNLCLKECHSDTTIICQGKHFYAHKLVLATCSEYFEQIFSQTNCKHPFIIINELKPKDLEALLSFMYKGEVNVPQDNLPNLIKAAEILSIKGLAVPDEISDYDKNVNDDKIKERKRISPHPKRRKTNLEENHWKGESETTSFSEDSANETTSISPNTNNSDNFHKSKFDIKFVDIKEEPLDSSEVPRSFNDKEIYYDAASRSRENDDKHNQESLEEQFRSVSPVVYEKSSNVNLFPANEIFSNSINRHRPINETEDSGFPPGFSAALDFVATGPTNFEVSDNISSGSTERKTFQCQFCPYQCYNRTHAIYHSRKHTGEKPFMCEICFKQFSVKHNLARHMFNAHGEQSKRTSSSNKNSSSIYKALFNKKTI